MPLHVRVASFNCENYFTRASLLNGDNAAAKPKLEALASLQEELSKSVYDAASILKFYKLIQGDVIVRENKGKLFRKSGGKLVVVPKGRDDWEGWIDLERDRLSPEGQDNTARVLKAVNADIQAVVEMEDRDTLARFGKSAVLGASKFAHAMLIDGNDPRGIDVGLLSKYEITSVRSNVDARDQSGIVFSRDCLEARVDLPGKRSVWLLVNHLKSQGYGSQASNDKKRLRQSEYIANEVLPRYDLDKDLFVVAGDFNADTSSASLAPLVKHPKLVDVLATKLPAQQQWTYAYGTKKQRLDYLLCSKAMAKLCTAVGIERRGLWNLSKLTGNAQQPFPTVTKQANSASDHAAVYGDFELP